MTIIIETPDRGLIERIKKRSEVFYRWMDIDKEHLPISIHDTENSIEIYVTDEFTEYSTEFFTNWMSQVLDDSDAAEYVSTEFRKGSEEFLVSDIILHDD